MKKALSFTTLLFSSLFVLAQSDYYYPPTGGDTWETITPEEIGWCEEEIPALIQYLDDRDTKAFILLYKGRIVVEQYYGDFDATTNWWWNSAGKTVTAFSVGKAQELGLLDIDDPVSDYLGEGWTSLTPEQEIQITIRHQLQMTTGLDDGVDNNACTDPECIQYLAAPGTRWAYHNAPYTLLTEVVAAASGTAFNGFVNTHLNLTIGMSGLSIPIGFNRVFLSRARDMARFGHLILSGGEWNGNSVMTDSEYFNAMITPSQDINESYGYLWWLNGQPSYMLPGVQLELPGSFTPTAPDDMVAAIGLNAQLINVSASNDLVFIRMGDDPGFGAMSFLLIDGIWEYLNLIVCDDVSVSEADDEVDFKVYPNPAVQAVNLEAQTGDLIQVFSATGGSMIREFRVTSNRQQMDVSDLSTGLYLFVSVGQSGRRSTQKVMIQH